MRAQVFDVALHFVTGLSNRLAKRNDLLDKSLALLAYGAQLAGVFLATQSQCRVLDCAERNRSLGFAQLLGLGDWRPGAVALLTLPAPCVDCLPGRACVRVLERLRQGTIESNTTREQARQVLVIIGVEIGVAASRFAKQFFVSAEANRRGLRCNGAFGCHHQKLTPDTTATKPLRSAQLIRRADRIAVAFTCIIDTGLVIPTSAPLVS